MSTVPILAPDGSAWDIPQDKVAAAVKAGGKIAADMSAPDGSRWTIPLDRVHDAIHSGGQLAPSSAAAFAGASVPKPADPMQHVTGYDLIGPVGDSFSNRVGNRIGQNLEAVAGVPAEAQREISEAQANRPQSYSQGATNVVHNTADAITGTLRKLWSDWTSDPANIAGDIVTGYVGGEALGGAEGEAQAAKPAESAAPAASSSTASDVANAVGKIAKNQAMKFASREVPLLGRFLRTYDFLKQIGGDAHAPELTAVTDGLNDLSQAVIQRINAAKAAGLTDRQAVLNARDAGLSDVAQPAADQTQANALGILKGTPKAVRSFADVRDDQIYQDYANADLENQGYIGRLQESRDFAARNSMDAPKWQRVLNQKVDQLIQQAEQKQTSSPAVKPYSAAPKAKAATAAAGGDDDLTDILKASLDIARKKRGK